MLQNKFRPTDEPGDTGRSAGPNTTRSLKTDCTSLVVSTMDASDFVRIEIEQLSGELALEIKLHVRASEFEARASGSNVTWSANGVRVVVPAGALESLRQAILRILPDRDERPS